MPANRIDEQNSFFFLLPVAVLLSPHSGRTLIGAERRTPIQPSSDSDLSPR
jgi:hypothetical protein